MKKTFKGDIYYFVDESGDPCFYDKRGNNIVGQEGCSKMLMLGFIQTEEPTHIRKALQEAREKIRSDQYLKGIPSIEKSLKHFHATDDCPEVRQEVYKCLSVLNFKSQFVVARKIEGVFKKHGCDENRFYDSLISYLFKNVLHRAETNYIYFSKRGSSTRQEPLENAIERAKDHFEPGFCNRI